MLLRRSDTIGESHSFSSATGFPYYRRVSLVYIEDSNNPTVSYLCCKTCSYTVCQSNRVIKQPIEFLKTSMFEYELEILDDNFSCYSATNDFGERFDILRCLPDRSLVLRGDPSDRHCWFPGYSWTFLHCPGCQLQIGWSYSKGGVEEFSGLLVTRLRESKANKLIGHIDLENNFKFVAKRGLDVSVDCSEALGQIVAALVDGKYFSMVDHEGNHVWNEEHESEEDESDEQDSDRTEMNEENPEDSDYGRDRPNLQSPPKRHRSS